MNYISSFGFSALWRSKFIKEIEGKPGGVAVDLMTGMGECWEGLIKNANGKLTLIGIDFSSEMLKHAEQQKLKLSKHPISILKENIFENSIEAGIADTVISGFGLKTFNEAQLHQLAEETQRLLKVGGNFSMLDVSLPKNKLLLAIYGFYIKRVIPLVGKLFLGNPETYKMLGIYTAHFKNAKEVESIFKQYQFEVEYISYFFGCATGIKGVKLS